MAVLTTIVTGTVLATGKTFTHGLGTTPDLFDLTPGPLLTWCVAAMPLIIMTYSTQTFVIGGGYDGQTFSASVIKLHSIIR